MIDLLTIRPVHTRFKSFMAFFQYLWVMICSDSEPHNFKNYSTRY